MRGAATASRWRRGALSRSRTARASSWATSCCVSRSRENLPGVLSGVLGRDPLLSGRRHDAAGHRSGIESRGPGDRRPLSRDQEAGRRRDGAGLSRRAREDGTPQRHQGDEPGDDSRPRRDRALQPRSVEREPDHAPQRLRRLRFRRDARGPDLPGDGVRGGRAGADVVKVVDFGIAKAVGGDETGQKVTKTGLVVGTPEFMSPEQLSGDKVDGRSDLYALALVLYRMLTGKLPFEASTVQETMIKRLTDEPAPLAATRPDLAFPSGLQGVLDTALTRSPVDRYQ